MWRNVRSSSEERPPAPLFLPTLTPINALSPWLHWNVQLPSAASSAPNFNLHNSQELESTSGRINLDKSALYVQLLWRSWPHHHSLELQRHCRINHPQLTMSSFLDSVLTQYFVSNVRSRFYQDLVKSKTTRHYPMTILVRELSLFTEKLLDKLSYSM
jgi:hypothetical protein